MNFKVQLGKKIHKLPQGLKSFDELIFVIRTIFSQKLPDQYTFKYEDSDKDWIGLESQDDFEAAVGFFKENNVNSIKIKIVRSLKPALELYVTSNFDNEMTQSRIIAFANKNADEDLGESTIFKCHRKSDAQRALQEQAQTIQDVESQKIVSNDKQENKQIREKIDEAKLIEKILSEQVDNLEQQEQKNSAIVKEEQQNNNNNIDKKMSEADKITLSYNQLQKMIEDIVEQKINTILSNYNLVPKSIEEIQKQQKHPQQQREQQNNNNYPSIVVNDVDEERKEDFSNQVSENSDQKIPSSQQSDSLSQSEIEKRKLRAILKTDPPAELNVESGSPYVWNFQLENSGSIPWPKNTFFRCLQGPHKDQKIEIDQVKPQGVLDIQIPLEAPLKAGKYQEIWSLVHEVPEKPMQNFGPKVRYSLTVLEEVNIPKEKPVVNINQNQQKASISISDPQNNSKVNTKVLDLAKQMKEFLGGELKKYTEFILMSNSNEKLSLEELINIYIDNQKF